MHSIKSNCITLIVVARRTKKCLILGGEFVWWYYSGYHFMVFFNENDYGVVCHMSPVPTRACLYKALKVVYSSCCISILAE